MTPMLAQERDSKAKQPAPAPTWCGLARRSESAIHVCLVPDDKRAIIVTDDDHMHTEKHVGLMLWPIGTVALVKPKV